MGAPAPLQLHVRCHGDGRVFLGAELVPDRAAMFALLSAQAARQARVALHVYVDANAYIDAGWVVYCAQRAGLSPELKFHAGLDG
ncbi:MAG: hypothetical protein V4582_06970 [Pseudomonadota bacterium]